MDIKQKTKVNEQNLNSFFQNMYHHQFNNKEQLVDLNSINDSTVIAVDCCGWHYKKIFPNKSIVAVETIKTVKQFNLDKTYFDRLIDNQTDCRLGWPSIPPGNCAVIFDRSPLLKYQTLDQISNILIKAADKYLPGTIVLEQSLKFIDDIRLVDRFDNLAKLAVDGYIVKKFNYDTDLMHLSITFQKKVKTA